MSATHDVCPTAHAYRLQAAIIVHRRTARHGNRTNTTTLYVCVMITAHFSRHHLLQRQRTSGATNETQAGDIHQLQVQHNQILLFSLDYGNHTCTPCPAWMEAVPAAGVLFTAPCSPETGEASADATGSSCVLSSPPAAPEDEWPRRCGITVLVFSTMSSRTSLTSHMLFIPSKQDGVSAA
eukprot:scpid57937/ scgid25608/ 